VNVSREEEQQEQEQQEQEQQEQSSSLHVCFCLVVVVPVLLWWLFQFFVFLFSSRFCRMYPVPCRVLLGKLWCLECCFVFALCHWLLAKRIWQKRLSFV
jgi:hypothetical protein